MAKRKRLSPALPSFLGASTLESSPSTGAPIAQLAGDTAAIVALQEVAGVLQQAREEGRIIVPLPLDSIKSDYLVRDRIALADDAMNSLKQSLVSRGQQSAIEVVLLPKVQEGGGQNYYGLISGWRRFTALQALYAETGEERFGSVLALVRDPDDLAASYVAMVEENEIRADLSFFERARIVQRSLETGVFKTEKQALQSLFSTASYARRSKIKSFIPIVIALEGDLKFPENLTERVGLKLSKALTDTPDFEAQLRGLLGTKLRKTAAQENDIIHQAIMSILDSKMPVRDEMRPAEPKRKADIKVTVRPGKIELTGSDINADFSTKLHAWLKKYPNP